MNVCLCVCCCAPGRTCTSSMLSRSSGCSACHSVDCWGCAWPMVPNAGDVTSCFHPIPGGVLTDHGLCMKGAGKEWCHHGGVGMMACALCVCVCACARWRSSFLTHTYTPQSTGNITVVFCVPLQSVLTATLSRLYMLPPVPEGYLWLVHLTDILILC